ncbi:MAG: TatD family hydrolase [Bacteroidales bacterium]|nr:TatD family hydrolase [Bacteroidales bacterium]
MVFVDTHTHLYLDEFDEDREKVLKNAFDKKVNYLLFPNVDTTTIDKMLEVCSIRPDNYFPMLGLHPSSVKNNYKNDLEKLEEYFLKNKFYAIGEIGIDLYWDKTFIKEQEIVFKHQILLAEKYDLPVVIHSRNSFNEIYNILLENKNLNLRGVFHCFTGTLEQAEKIIALGFKLGIGGVVTFKNSGLDRVVKEIDLKNILLETDSPYLTPVPFRGKRNESANIYYIAKKIAEIKNFSLEQIAQATTNNAVELFKFI